jgi:hypothetical protein
VRWGWPLLLFPLSVWRVGVLAWWHDGGGVRLRRAVGAATAPAPFFISKNTFAEGYCALSAHIHREGADEGPD